MLVIKESFKFLIVFLALTAVYLGLININSLSVSSVLYYKMVFLLLLVTAGGVLILYFLRKAIGFTSKDLLLLITIFFSFHFSFISVVVVSLDRSISVLMLCEMADCPSQSFSKEDLDNVYSSLYVNKYDPIKRRIEEQVASKNIELINGEYKITETGQRTVALFRFISKFYPVSKDFIYPENVDVGHQ